MLQLFPFIYSRHSFRSYAILLLAQYSNLFSLNSRSTNQLHTLSHIHPFSHHIILYSFNMAKPTENTFTILSSTIFVTPHNSLIRTFGTLFILLIPSKPLKLSTCTSRSLDLSFSLHILGLLPNNRTGTSNSS